MNIQMVDYRSKDASKALAESLHETGFAVLTHHPILHATIDTAYQSWGAFFADEEKHAYIRDPETQDGYFPFKSEHAKNASAKDLKEFYHVYPWGRIPPPQEVLTRQIYADLLALGIELLGWLDRHIPAANAPNVTLQDMMSGSQQSLLRILHYPPLTSPSDDPASDHDAGGQAIRAAAHEDINLITLLLSGSAPGLQAQDRQGAWHDVSCDAGMITINNGDMLALATDNFFPSTTHRVVNPEARMNHSRYSMPMFLHPRPDVELVPSFTADQFLQQRLRDIGLK